MTTTVTNAESVPTTQQMWNALRLIVSPTLQAATVVILTFDGETTVMSTYSVPQVETP